MKLAWKAGGAAHEGAINPVRAATGSVYIERGIPASRAACYAIGMSAWTSTGRLITAHRDVKDSVVELFADEEA